MLLNKKRVSRWEKIAILGSDLGILVSWYLQGVGLIVRLARPWVFELGSSGQVIFQTPPYDPPRTFTEPSGKGAC